MDCSAVKIAIECTLESCFMFDIDDRVVVSGGKQGIVRFIGETEFAQGIWAGIELEQPLGKNDGSVQGKRYFTCKTPYGVFVPASKTQRAPSQTPNRAKQSHGTENATIKALQDALQEKERHLEQLMRERDMERSDFGVIGNGDQAEK
ncbi:CAP-Gly domain protein, partial [Ostertagia ostertagi]